MNPTPTEHAIETARLAALVHTGVASGGPGTQCSAPTASEAGADALLATWVQELQSAGRRVGGVLQHITTWPRGGRRMQLKDVRRPQTFDISQNLGPEATGCCLDTGGVAHASSVLHQALVDRVDVVVVNRFGGLEAKGEGFFSDIAALLDAGIPVLTIVAPKHLAAWRELTGPLALELHLPLPVQALHDWFNRLQHPSSSA